MRRVHVIIDLYYMFYRYKYTIESGRMRHLYATVDDENIDVSYIYYTLRGIETELAKFKDDEVTVSVCIDSYTDRKEASSDYKTNRAKLQTCDLFNLQRIEGILRQVGYNVYKEYNAEADDLITGLVNLYHKDFDMTYIFTPDADILINLKQDVHVYRFKSSLKAHVLVTPENFSELLGKEYGCDMPYNCIVLYKALCGDKSDKIAGVKGFGARSFDRLIESLRKDNFDFRWLASYKNVETAILMKEAFITGGDKSKLAEAMQSLELIKNRETEVVKSRPIRNADIENNKRAVYGEQYHFNSLI